MSENSYDFNQPEKQAYCSACDAELKTGARFCSRCGQPAMEAMNNTNNGKLFEQTTRRLAVSNYKSNAVKAGSRKTQPLKPFPHKQRGYQILALSLAANCVLVMAFALAISHIGFPSQETVPPLIAEFAASDDGQIFFDSSFEPPDEEPEHPDEHGGVRECAMTPVFEIERPLRRTQTSGVRAGKDGTAVKKSATERDVRARRTVFESPQHKGSQSVFIESAKARRDERNEARAFKVLATFNDKELMAVAADFNREMSRLLPAVLQTGSGKAEVKAQKEIERAGRKVMHEQRKRSLRRIVSTRGTEFVTVSCVTVPDAAPNAAPEVPVPAAPTFVIKAETHEGLGF